MHCQEIKQLLNAHVDGELDLVKSLEIEEHLGQCPVCEQAHEDLLAVRACITGAELHFRAPPELAERVRSALGNQKGSPTRRRLPGQLALAASLLIAALGGWAIGRYLPANTAASSLEEQLLASHVRSQMLPGHRFDVESSDQHTVKPWFEGKLDFAPPVYDPAAQGFPLVGGRLDYVDHHAVAVLAYQRRQHFINLYIWPSEPSTATASSLSTRQGFHFLSWTQDGMTYWAVSDLNESELEQFAKLIAGR